MSTIKSVIFEKPKGEHISNEGFLITNLVKSGTLVGVGDELAEIDNHDATLSFPSPFSGRVEKLSMNVGDEVVWGKTLLTMTVS